MSQVKCLRCKRFLPRTGICSFCRTDNNSANQAASTSSAVFPGDRLLSRATPDCDSHPLSCSAAISRASGDDITLTLTNLNETLASLLTKIDSLSDRIAGLESKVCALDQVNDKFDYLESKIRCLEGELSRLGCTSGSTDHATLSNALDGRLADIESRCTALEGAAAPGNTGMRLQSVEYLDSVAGRLERFERSQRDLELIIFGVPNVVDEKLLDTITIVAAGLDTTISSAEIVDSFRIRGKDPLFPPIVVRLPTMAKRNQWIALARRRRNLTASSLRNSWPPSRVLLCERSTASERKTYNEARSLARLHGIKYVWMRRGITYFRPRDGAESQRYLSPESIRHLNASAPVSVAAPASQSLPSASVTSPVLPMSSN